MTEFLFNQDYFVVGMYNEYRKSTTYFTNKYESFSDKCEPSRKMEVLVWEEYLVTKE